MKRLKEKSGSALLWTVMALGMLMVFATAVLTVSMAYSKRNLNQNQNQQSYFTAVSAVDLVAGQFTGIFEKNSPQQKIIDKLAKGESIVIDDMKLPPEMGTCTVTMSMRGRDIVITADAKKGEESYRLSGIMNGEVTIIHPDRPDYGGDGTPGVGAGGIGGGGNGMQTDPGTNIYIWNNDPFVMNSVNGSRDTLHMAALYTNGTVELRQDKWNNYSHIHGEIISTNDITLFDDSSVGLLPEEFLPIGRNSCCDSTKMPDPCPGEFPNTAIHSTATVRATQDSRVGGGIVANEILVQDTARVSGDLHGDKVTVTRGSWHSPQEEYYTVKGNITGNTVAIGGYAVIHGDITADTLRITGSPTIVGSITAKNVEFDCTSDISYAINGDITAGSITMHNFSEINGNVTAEQLTMNNNSKIFGNASAATVVMNVQGGTAITGDLFYYASPNSIDTVLRRRVEGTVTRFGQKPPALALPEPLPPITSKLPPKPSPPPIPDMPTDPKPKPLGSHGRIDVGVTSEDSYYLINKNGVSINNLNVVSDNNIFIYLADGCTATVSKIIDDGSPNVFFILGNGSTLKLAGNNGHPLNAYVWSKEGSGATLNLETSTKLNGGIWVDHVISADNCEFHWIDPPEITLPPPPPVDPDKPIDPTDPPAEGDEIITKWGLAAYENR